MRCVDPVIPVIPGWHQFFVAQNHLSDLKYQFFVIRDLVERVKTSLPRQAEMDRCGEQPGIGSHCDSAANVRRDSQSGERPIPWQTVARRSPASPGSRGQRNTRSIGRAVFSEAAPA
jgi:hypothetical protein